MGFSQARGFVSEGSNVLIADVLEQAGRTLGVRIHSFARRIFHEI